MHRNTVREYTRRTGILLILRVHFPYRRPKCQNLILAFQGVASHLRGNPIIQTRKIMEMIDLHCHIMPYVDDGAANLEEAMALLRLEAQQGITDICLTPHLRAHMFTSTDEKVLEGYERLKAKVQEEQLPLTLYFSREYYYDSDFRELLEAGHLIPIGAETLLLEFNYASSAKTLREAAKAVLDAGYTPLFAHVERYQAVQSDTGLVKQLTEMGTKIQVNAASLLGQEGWKKKWCAKALLRAELVDVIASDCHDVQVRVPNLAKCAVYLEKKFGRERMQQLLHDRPLYILKDTAEE